MNDSSNHFIPACPLPIETYSTVTMAHGGGGKMMGELIEKIFLKTFGPSTNAPHDSFTFESKGDAKLAFTTDTYVVRPLFFPGGDIGSLAVHGTVNDLAMCGARPLYLSAGFILEEGLAMETLWRVAQSMKHAADEAGVSVVTGDTKVVDNGKGDGVYINTAGVGRIEARTPMEPESILEGDVVIVSGDLGRHGMAIMAMREGLEFETTIESDSASLAEIVMKLIEEGIDIHCMRDLTRGGLTSALNELAGATGLSLYVKEREIPIDEQVRGACEILGLDPLSVANEGRFVLFLPKNSSDAALQVLRAFECGRNAACIGTVKANPSGKVFVETSIGSARVLPMPSGQALPRIC